MSKKLHHSNGMPLRTFRLTQPFVPSEKRVSSMLSNAEDLSAPDYGQSIIGSQENTLALCALVSSAFPRRPQAFGPFLFGTRQPASSLLGP